MIVLGIDPDLHNTGMAIACLDKIHWVGVAEVDKGFKEAGAVPPMMERVRYLMRVAWEFLLNESGLCIFNPEEAGFDRVVIEGQHYNAQRDADPNDLIHLAQVAGAAGGVATQWEILPLVPRPQEWKGSVPKPIHQARILARLGLDYKKVKTHAYPIDKLQMTGISGAHGMRSKDWKHVVDAMGLALWGLTSGAR